ncbi:unnamed protein product [Ectocarpus sp. 6 AP-2014]
MFFSRRTALLVVVAATALLAPDHVSLAATTTDQDTTGTVTATSMEPTGTTSTGTADTATSMEPTGTTSTGTADTATSMEPTGTTTSTGTTESTTSMEPTGTTTSTVDEDDEPGGSYEDCDFSFAGDGKCHEDLNTEVCGYDGGDCCSCTCEPGAFNCGGGYNCIDPEAVCVEDDDGDGGELTTADLEDDGITDEMADDARTADDDTSASGTTSLSSIVTGVATAAGVASVFAAYAL